MSTTGVEVVAAANRLPTTCWWCGRPVRPVLWRTVLNRNLCQIRTPRRRDECWLLGLAMRSEPSDEEWDWIEDEPPEDRFDCPSCEGYGEVITGRDWSTGALNTVECRRCEGTGSLEAYGG